MIGGTDSDLWIRSDTHTREVRLATDEDEVEGSF